jgi:ATP-dependent Clp protease ATP-binding subunit ClpA
MGFGGSSRGRIDYSGYLSRFFCPEFINQLDEVITFHILDLQLKETYTRLRSQGIGLEMADDARQLILDKGCTLANGARPLRRAIECLLTCPLSAKIVEEGAQRGDGRRPRRRRGSPGVRGGGNGIALVPSDES